MDRRFTIATDEPHEGRRVTGRRLKDGRVLVVGGRDEAGTLLDSAEVYDPVRNM